MNITSIHLYSTMDVSGTSYKHMELALTNPSHSSSYIIRSATGLDVDEIFAKTYNVYNSPTTRYYNLAQPPRTISVLLSLNPQYHLGETVSGLRDNIYKMIAYTRNAQIELRFMNDATEVASLYGFFSKVESGIFTSETQIQLTFSCEYPFLTSRNYVTVSSPGIPTPSWTDSLSTAPHGFKMAITFTSTPPNPFTIQGIAGSTITPFMINYALATGDTLYLSSEDNDRYVYRMRSSARLDLMDKLVYGSSIWPEMYPGVNSITIPTSNFTWVELKYRATYWGI